MNVLFTTVARVVATAAVSVIYAKGIEKTAADVEKALAKSKAKRAQIKAAREAAALILSEKRDAAVSALIKAGKLHVRSKTYYRDGNEYEFKVHTSKPLSGSQMHHLMVACIKSVQNDDHTGTEYLNGFGFEVAHVKMVHRVKIDEHTSHVGEHEFSTTNRQFDKDVESGIYDVLAEAYAVIEDETDVIEG